MHLLSSVLGQRASGQEACNGKILFLQSQTTTTRDDMKGGVVNRGMFIERMEECSKYSRERNLRFASDEARTDNKR